MAKLMVRINYSDDLGWSDWTESGSPLDSILAQAARVASYSDGTVIFTGNITSEYKYVECQRCENDDSPRLCDQCQTDLDNTPEPKGVSA